jgi:hypothetical protein
VSNPTTRLDLEVGVRLSEPEPRRFYREPAPETELIYNVETALTPLRSTFPRNIHGFLTESPPVLWNTWNTRNGLWLDHKTVQQSQSLHTERQVQVKKVQNLHVDIAKLACEVLTIYQCSPR